MDKIAEIKEKIKILNEASEAYYTNSQEIMSDLKYDQLYSELETLERETGVVFSNSPTGQVGYEVLKELPKEAHEYKMLSLDKTKDIEELKSWVGDKRSILSWKLDGLTVVITYVDGKLFKAVTRGNGEVGEVITSNAKTFLNLPVKIPYKEELVLRGEAIITYSQFERINQKIPELDAKYKNPRNLCSGSVRQLDSKITAERNIRFIAFSTMVDIDNSKEKQQEFLKSLGFEIVEYLIVEKAEEIDEKVKWFSEKIQKNDYPSDGLVLSYDDLAYGKSLGATSKFPRDSIAFKWRDELKRTHLREIEWSPSRTGLINPIAIFEPVELEGTTVSRASVHNISILKELKLGIGDEIEVYKANMIIPQIGKNITASGNVTIPENCPVCNQKTVIKDDNKVETLHCINPDCPAKKIKAFTLFVSRNALNIEGLSEATIEKFVEKGFIKNYGDFFSLKNYEEEIKSLEGFGEKSYINLIESIDNSRVTTPEKVIYGLGIAGIGVANAKLIAKFAMGDFEKIINLKEEALVEIDGVGQVMAKAFVNYFKKEENLINLKELLRKLDIHVEKNNLDQTLEGKIIVITGSLEKFENRDIFKEYIEKRGGRVTGTVSSKTDILINNNGESKSSKNKKAKDLGVLILSEEEFLREYGE